MHNKRQVCSEDILLGLLPASIITAIIYIAAAALEYTQAASKGLFLATIFVSIFGYILFCVVYVWFKTTGYPDFVTHQGVQVWAHGIPVTKPMLDRALNFYVERAVDLDFHLTKAQLFLLLNKVHIEWCRGKAHRTLCGWDVAEKDGALVGHYMRLRWCGSLSDSLLFHLLHHQIADLLYGDPDIHHVRKSFWLACKQINNAYELTELTDTNVASSL
jgi:hypothetical protein